MAKNKKKNIKKNHKLSKSKRVTLKGREDRKIIKKHKWKRDKTNIVNMPTTITFNDANKSSTLDTGTIKHQPGSKFRKALDLKKNLSLREKMTKQLDAARFRQINETLDSGTDNPTQAFGDDHNVYTKYHQIYKDIRLKWETNPLDEILKTVKQIQLKNQTSQRIQVADFGCGEGDLEKSLQNTSMKVYSLDLFKLHPNTIVCDMSNVPLENNTIDVVVFSLALMAKDVGKFIAEANRVLKLRGTLLIAEVEARFVGGVKRFTMSLKSYGFITSKLRTKDRQGDGNLQNCHRRLNDMFIIMEFTKTKHVAHRKQQLPSLCMKPCVYKKR